VPAASVSPCRVQASNQWVHAVALADQAHFIRSTAASVIDWLYRGIGPENWPEALEKMLQMAESDNNFAQEVR
jgi:hypothetical protein